MSNRRKRLKLVVEEESPKPISHEEPIEETNRPVVKRNRKTKGIVKAESDSKVETSDPQEVQTISEGNPENTMKTIKKISVPKNWETMLENIRTMRSGRDAPVDTMGCDRTVGTDVPPKVQRFGQLVSLMLSSQTKDATNYAAMQRLQKESGGLTVQNILDIPEEKLGELITPVSFWRTKAKHLKKTAAILRDKYEDDIPNNAKELTLLPGVGPKMAYICLHVAWNINEGIGVDTHVHRITNRLKWTGPKTTKTPEQTREALQSWLPKDLWQEVNHILVGFGQTICKPTNPKCSECLNRKICPSSTAKK